MIQKLRIEYMYVGDLTPYKNNAKLHPDEQIEQIKESIEKFGFNDPIAIWGKDNIIIEGHGRLQAAKELGIDQVPIVRLDDLSDEERKAYTLVHNKLTMNSGYDFDTLQKELNNISDIDMSDFGFDDNEMSDIDGLFKEAPQDNDDSANETHMIKCPHCGEMIEINSDFEVVM